MDKTKEWQMEMLMEKLRSKSGQYKSFIESAKALRMTLLEKRYPIDNIERGQLQKCLDTLQQNIKVTTHQAMVERLESVSRQLGLKFVMGSGLDLFISSDMFYLEIVLDGTGGVKDVKIHHEGREQQSLQSCEELVACLTRRDFSDFTAQLEGLASIYQLNAEKKIKSKAYSALTSLETDLATLASLQSHIKDPMSLVHKSSIGVLEKRKGGHPMKLTYFVSPYDLLDPLTRTSKPLTTEGLNVGYSVSVCMESSSAHKLQTAPLISVNRSPNNKNWPVYAPLVANNSITVAGCFVLTLNKPMPVCVSVVKSIQSATQCECADLSSPHPLLSLITQHSSGGQADSANNRGLFVKVQEQDHCYLMTERRGLEGVLVNSIPFTHPSHVAQVLALLRQQAIFNTIIASCVRPNTKQEIEKMIMFEVTPLTWQHLSISLEHPLEESMATVELDLTDIMNITCKVYTTAGENGSTTSEYATKVFQRCLSIPVTMRSLINQWHTQHQRMTGTYNGGGLGSSGGSGGGMPMGHLGEDLEPGMKIKLEPGLDLSSLVGRQGNFVSDQTLSDPGFEVFSAQMETGDISITATTVSAIPFSSLDKGNNVLELIEHKTGKRRKRKGGDLWRSPKRKHGEDDGVLDSSSSDSSPLGTPSSRDASDMRLPTPTSTSGLEFSALSELDGGLVEKTQSDIDVDDIIPVQDVEDEEEIMKTVKKPKRLREEKKSASEILFDFENKNLVPPSVSITPISSSQMNSQNLNSVLTGMCLDRRPGIEIIPIVPSTTTTLPSSLTITPISSKSIPEDRLKSERKSSRSSKTEDKSRIEKKRKRKREDSPMGPPEKVPIKSDPLSKPVSVSIKPADSSSPRSSSPLRKFTSSPTHTSPLTIVGKSSPSSSLNKSAKSQPQQSPKHSPAYPTSSPKNSITSSPKHGTSSPKHQSSSGKPSMSTLKSAVSSPSKSESKTKSKDSRDKDRKGSSSSSGHSSPKMKSSIVKLKQLDLATIDVPQMLQTGGSTPPSTGDGGKSSVAQMRNRKGSLSAVIDKLKSAHHCGEEGNGKEKKESKDRSTSGKLESKSLSKPGETKPGEYMVKPSSDGMKLTINKTRTKDSSKVKSSGTGSPKTHTGLKPGLNSGSTSKRSPHAIQKSSSPGLKSSSSSGKSTQKSSLSSQKSARSAGSPKTSDPNRIRDKPRIPKSSSDKSIFSSSKSDAKKLSPASLREDSDFKCLPSSTSISPQLVVEGLMKQLDTNFQIPKLSARNASASQSDESKKLEKPGSESRSLDSPKVIDLASKQDLKFVSSSKNSDDIRISSDTKPKSVPSSTTITLGSSSPKLSTSKISLDISDSPNISIIPVTSDKDDKEPKGYLSGLGSSHGMEDVLSSLKMELPISSLTFGCDPDKPDDIKKTLEKCKTTTSNQEAAELLLDFSSSAPKGEATSKLITVSERAIAATMPVRKNTPPPLPPPAFPGSPSVSVHIVKSPAPSPLVMRSPPSSSPCITDDELMDEAVVGIGK